MEKFDHLEGVAAPLRIINVDTDMIIPKQYLKTIKRTGLAKGLFSEQRYLDDGAENPDFVLNKPAYRKSKILVAGDNFGCGSSREHAPWALMDFGIRCVISTSFGDIFYNNCFKNGVLPIRVSPEDLEKLFDDAERGANSTLSIDLEKQEIKGPDGGTVKFEIDAHRKHCMLNGLDDIGLTKLKADKIVSYEAKAQAARPWAYLRLLPTEKKSGRNWQSGCGRSYSQTGALELFPVGVAVDCAGKVSLHLLDRPAALAAGGGLLQLRHRALLDRGGRSAGLRRRSATPLSSRCE